MYNGRLELDDALNNEQFLLYLDRQQFIECYKMLAKYEFHKLTEFLLEESLDPLKDLDFIPDLFFSHLSFSEFNIPDRIKKLGGHAFSHNQELEKIYIPDSVTQANVYTFYNCNKLKEVRLSHNQKILSQHMFQDCKELLQIDIPEGITELGESCFESCFALRKVKLPHSLVSIDGKAFCSCSSLKNITYNGTIEEWKQVAESRPYVWLRVPTTKIYCKDGETNLRR